MTNASASLSFALYALIAAWTSSGRRRAVALDDRAVPLDHGQGGVDFLDQRGSALNAATICSSNARYSPHASVAFRSIPSIVK
jgi:hypothetical protein